MTPFISTIGRSKIAKFLSGIFYAAVLHFQPLDKLFYNLLIFIAIDFVTGIWADKVRRGKRFRFSSKKLWRTVYKTVFGLVGIVLFFQLDTQILQLEDPLHLANYFTAYICGAELWSWLENASDISGHNIFLWFRRAFSRRMKEDTGLDFENDLKDHDDDTEK